MQNKAIDSNYVMNDRYIYFHSGHENVENVEAPQEKQQPQPQHPSFQIVNINNLTIINLPEVNPLRQKSTKVSDLIEKVSSCIRARDSCFAITIIALFFGQLTWFITILRSETHEGLNLIVIMVCGKDIFFIICYILIQYCILKWKWIFVICHLQLFACCAIEVVVSVFYYFFLQNTDELKTASLVPCFLFQIGWLLVYGILSWVVCDRQREQ